MFELKNKLPRILLFILSVVIFISIVLGSIYFIFEFKYANKIYPGIYIGEMNMSGKTLSEAKNIINKKLDSVNQDGITFLYENNKVVVYPINSSSDAAVVDVFIDFKDEKTIDEAMAIGRSGNLLIDAIDKLSPFFKKNHYIKLAVGFDEKKIIDYLKQGFAILNPENATYYFDSEGNLLVRAGKNGKIINFDKSVKTLKSNLDKLDFSSIVLRGFDAQPEISEADCLAMKGDVVNALELTPIKLKYSRKEWAINQEDFLKMIALSKKNSILSVNLDREKIKKYIEEKVAPEIDRDSVLPKFTVNEGKVENFEPGGEGRKLDVDMAVNSVSNLLIVPFEELNLSVNEIPVSSAGEDKNVLGIKEIIGEYTLKFDGSTTARIANIKNGAKSLNGLLLKSGEEFSTLKALGSVDEAHGYVKEAVIRGNAISYDFGGGLCHVSTTLFRAVLDSGLPVTMRKNHSYDMPYYEPAGVDATIYDPDPDFRFINDMPNYVLLQAEVSKGSLTIQIWGTKDGRTVNRTEPVMYNIVRPKPTKIVGTYTLATGQRKCTYAAYNGSDTYFDYEVAYSSGEVKKERFSSHYVPRQGVCLVGL